MGVPSNLMARIGSSARSTAVVVLVLLAACGVLLELTLSGFRDWLFNHPFTTGILVGIFLISATYLVVEQALEERERRRWAEATGPLLSALAAAGASTDEELRAAAVGIATGSEAAGEWLMQMLERYQALLTGTPDLIQRWHAALSLAQHARATQASKPIRLDSAYEAAWSRFRTTFADVHDFSATAASAGATWAMLPTVPRDR